MFSIYANAYSQVVVLYQAAIRLTIPVGYGDDESDLLQFVTRGHNRANMPRTVTHVTVGSQSPCKRHNL